MTLLQDLESRIEENQGRVADLIGQLERQVKLEQSLNSAGRGINSASVGIQRLAEATRSAVLSLEAMQTALQGAVTTLQRANPESVATAVVKMQLAVLGGQQHMIERTERAATAQKAAISEWAGKIMTRVEENAHAIAKLQEVVNLLEERSRKKRKIFR